MDSSETSALREAIDLAMRILRCADAIVRDRRDITRGELIELLSEIFLDDAMVAQDAVVVHDAGSWRRR